jgi:hypothetical protein
MIGESPSYEEGVHDIVLCPFCPSVAFTFVGGSAYVIAFTGAEGALGGDAPMAFVALTTNV